MSGPKVIDIKALRRQQQRAAAKQLRQLHALVESCLSMHEADPATAGVLRERSAALIERVGVLQAAEQWGSVLKEVSAHREFFVSEEQHLRRTQATRRAAALRHELHLRQTSARINAELRALPAATPGLSSVLDDLDRHRPEAIPRALDILAASRTAVGNSALRDAAAAFLDSAAETYPMPAGPPDPEEIRIARCCGLLAEMDGADQLAWHEKAAIVAASTGDERALRLDSLVLELTSHLKARQVHAAALADMRELVEDYAGVEGAKADEWRARLAASGGTSQLQALAIEARAWLEQDAADRDTQEQRAAVIRALSVLGYEVREGLATAWAENGSVVIHKPNDTLYGVELAAPRAGTAIQARVVAGGSQSRTALRDREAEQTWCGEFARLQALLADDGFQVQLLRAQPAGSVPVKTAAPALSGVERDRTLGKTVLARQAPQGQKERP